MVPTGVYIPQMVQLGLLSELDLAKIPNFTNIETQYTNQPWDPDNLHSVCKDWGSTGWICDTEAIDGEINTWNDFIAAAQGPASGKTSVLDAPGDLCGIYFWANGIDWTTEDQADLDACQEFTVNELAPHIKAFDSYPGIALTQGNYVLSQAWNGDARQGLIAVRGQGPRALQVGPGRAQDRAVDGQLVHPRRGRERQRRLRVDQLHPASPTISLKDLEFHGYNTGHQGRPGGGGRGRPSLPRRGLLRRGAGRHDRSRRRELGDGAPR